MSDLIVSDDGPIRTLRMNRPAKKNALTLAMHDAMAAAIEESGTNGAIRCLPFDCGRAWIILRGKRHW
jgi:enoyl-CoA hydratase/carnithine racemase